MPSIQRRHIARAQTLLLAFALFTFALALHPATSPAHPGHSHGLSNFDGRLPDQPDLERIGEVTTRFNPQTREYSVKRPGMPAMQAHVEAREPGDSEGAAVLGGYYSLPSYENAPACATRGHRIEVVRTYMEGSGHRADEEDAYISSIIRRMNWKFLQQSQLSSEGTRSLEMEVDCDERGAIDVHDVEIPLNYVAPGVDTTDGGADVIETIVYVGIVMGVPRNDQAVKHLIFDTRQISGFVGIGFLFPDPDKIDTDINLEGGAANPDVNSNRVNTTDAFIARNPNHTLDGRNSWESVIPVHELLHTMGASFSAYEGDPEGWVSAPYANTGLHCVDGIDILCYSSGTSREGSYNERRCPESAGYGSPLGVALDCAFDTYFDAKPESGEWLDRFWNVGGSENPFLVEERDPWRASTPTSMATAIQT